MEELDLPEYHDDKRQPGGHWGSFVCHDFIKMWTGDTWNNAAFEKAEKLCGRWSAYDHEGHGTGALETVPFKAMVESCDPELGCYNDINVHIELDLTLAGKYLKFKQNFNFNFLELWIILIFFLNYWKQFSHEIDLVYFI